MANANRPFGLRPVGTLRGGPYTGKVRKFYVPATDGTAIYIGDTVKIGGSAGSLYNDDVSYPTVAKAASGDVVIGVMVGIEPLPSDLSVNYRKASTGMYVFVDTDPDTIYEVQSDATGIAAASVHLNAEISVVAGSTVTGQSASVLTTPGADATHDLLVLGLSPAVDNDVSSAPYCRALVRLNLNQYADDALGIA